MDSGVKKLVLDKALDISDVVGGVLAVSSGPLGGIVSLCAIPLRKMLQKNMDDFLSYLDRGLKDVSIALDEEIKKNTRFQRLLLKVIPIVSGLDRDNKIHKQKIDSLKNIVVNGLYVTDLEEEQLIAFISYVDELPSSSVSVLSIFADHESELQNIDSYTALYVFVRNLLSTKLSDGEIRYISENLRSRYLICISSELENSEMLRIVADDSKSSNNLVQLTEIGKNFLRFISM